MGFNQEKFVSTFKTNEEQDFWNTLLEVKKSTKYIEGDLNTLLMGVVDGSDPEHLRKAETEGRMKIEIDGQEMPVYDMAMTSIKRRAKNEAAILREMKDEDIVKMLNMSWPYQGKERFKALFRGCGIQALMSGRYVPLHQWNVYQAFTEKLRNHFPNGTITFLDGYYTHQITEARYAVVDDKLLSDLMAKLDEVNFPYANDIRVILTLITSDTGESSVSVTMGIELGENEVVQFQKPLNVPHRDNQTFENVIKEFDRVFALTSDGLANLKRLADLTITYPTSVAANMVKKKPYKLPKALVDEVMPQLAMYEQMGVEISGLDFFRIMGRIKKSARWDAYTPKTKLQTEDTLARIAWIDQKVLDKYDVKGVAIY